MNNNVKYGIWVFVSLIVLVWIYFTFIVDNTNANPDYICVKNVDRSCSITNCWDWNEETKQRTCYWKRVTQVWYYHTRTSCESGFSVAINWSTNSSSTAASNVTDRTLLDSQWQKAHYAHPSSWRHSKNYDYASEDCSIIEEDTRPPVWEIEQID